MRVVVRAEVRPTESPEKVGKAILNFFDVKLREERYGDWIVLIGEGDVESLKKFRRALFQHKILDAARQLMAKGLSPKGFTFFLNKQAAFVGRISFCTFEYGESPLGAISVEVQSSDPLLAIRWLAPRTVQGTPVEEVDTPPDP
ncbi:MAG: hypothetical protein NZ954_02910 [Thermofilaceae archaeon]|nr:hypothetical protein [Thermofilaceae archaeon]MCX8181200.1 hypothetical protein [Thermofilaceae archaeon]MDW8004487.1 RNA-binding domain-containing protein [Thermofilaceae archaeon]